MGNELETGLKSQMPASCLVTQEGRDQRGLQEQTSVLIEVPGTVCNCVWGTVCPAARTDALRTQPGTQALISHLPLGQLEPACIPGAHKGRKRVLR